MFAGDGDAILELLVMADVDVGDVELEDKLKSDFTRRTLVL